MNKILLYTVFVFSLISCKKEKDETKQLSFKTEGLTSTQTINLIVKSNGSVIYRNNNTSNLDEVIDLVKKGDKIEFEWTSNVKRSQGTANNGKLAFKVNNTPIKESNGLILVVGADWANDYFYIP